MNIKLRFFIILAAFLTLLPLWDASGAPPPATVAPPSPIPFKKNIPISITADFLSYDEAANTYFARGNVVAVQDQTTLKADAIVADMASGIATASGNIEIIDEGGTSVKGENLVLNINTETAVLARGRLFFPKENIYITGETIKKAGPQTYEAEDVSFTACDCPEGENPAWSFRASSASVNLGEFLRGHDAYFYIKGVPVFYTPYVSLPVKRERQTGFLEPRPGYSKLRGFVFDNSFFWAIADNMDATFYLNIETSRGTGGAAEYRYIRTINSLGELYFNYYHERDINRVRESRAGLNLSRPLNAGSERWQFTLHHTENLGDGLEFRANVNQVSDNEYFIDFGRGANERAMESTESNISLSKRWSSYTLVTQFRLFKNLLIQDNSVTIQKLPEVTFTAVNQRILNSPFYISGESSFVYFYREKGVTAQRVDIHPRISLPLSAGGYFDITPSFAPRETLYLVRDSPDGDWFHRYLYDATLDLTTTFYRVFDTGFESINALRHSIRPRISYTYITGFNGSLPQFDAIDAIPATSTITYSLNNILTGKYLEEGVEKYRDYLYLDIIQSYDINEARRALTSDTDRRRPFSAITSELTLKPAGWYTLLAKGAYDVYKGDFTSYNSQLSLSDKRGDNLSLSYNFLGAGATGITAITAVTGTTGLTVITGATRYFEGSVKVHVIQPLDFSYIKRYSFDTHSSLEAAYTIDYRQQCWGATISYTSRPGEKLIMLTFSLKGLGRVAGITGSVGAL